MVNLSPLHPHSAIPTYHESWRQWHMHEVNELTAIIKEANELSNMCDAYMRHDYMSRIISKYPETASYIKTMPALEAWTVSPRLKAMLERFKNFFRRIFNYISRFLVVRIQYAAKIVQDYLKIISQPDDNKDTIEKMRQNYTDKGPSVEICTQVLVAAAAMYTDGQKQLETVKNTTVATVKGSENATTAAFGELPSEDKYKNAIEAWGKANPSKDNMGRTVEGNGEDAASGKWFDAGKVKTLSDSINSCGGLFINLKRLQVTCDSIIADLMKEDTSTPAEKTDNDEGKENANTNQSINNETLKKLREFSKVILTGVIRTITNVVTASGKKADLLMKAGKVKNEAEKAPAETPA